MEFSSLPDDALFCILNKFSLQELLRIRALNHRWNTLIRLFCCGKSTLKLFGSFSGLVDYTKRTKRYRLAVGPATDLQVSTVGTTELLINSEKMTPSVIAELLQLFPNTVNLVFFFYVWPPVDSLVTLLRSMPKLTSLVLQGAPMLPEEQDILWTALDGLGPQLKRLHLFSSSRLVIPGRLPVLSGLEHFSLTHYEGQIVPILAQLGPTCKVLLLEYVNLMVVHLAASVKMAPHLRASLTHLFLGAQFPAGFIMLPNGADFRADIRLDASTNAQQILAFICAHLVGLQYLDVTSLMPISYRWYNLSQNLDQLYRLPALTTLRLSLKGDDLEHSLLVLSPVKSVRTLYLELYPIASISRFLQVVSYVFPYLEYLHVEVYDKTNLAQLASQLSPAKEDEESDKKKKAGRLANLQTVTLYYQRHLKQYFSARGYAAHYRTYLKEQMGVLADHL